MDRHVQSAARPRRVEQDERSRRMHHAGLAVLGCFTAAGALVPLVMMLRTELADHAGWWAIGLFTSGIVALFGYIIRQVQHLTDHAA